MCLSLILVVASVSALNLALPDLAIGLSATNSALTWIADCGNDAPRPLSFRPTAPHESRWTRATSSPQPDNPKDRRRL